MADNGTAQPWRFLTFEEPYSDFSIATSPALERAVTEGVAPPTVALTIFSADGLTIGVNEDPTQVVDLDHCRAAGIVVRRRVNGGGAVFAGRGSAFIGLYLPVDPPRVPGTAAAAFPQVLTAFAETLEARFGLPARYRPLNDIEIEGRKIIPASLKIEAGVMTLRMVFNVTPIDTEAAARALPMPPEKVSDKRHKTLQSRFTCLEAELGRKIERAEIEATCRAAVAHAFGVERLEPGTLTAAERRWAADYHDQLGDPAWFYGKTLARRLPGGLGPADRAATGRAKAPGGMIWATVVIRDGRVRHAVVNGDFHPRPLASVGELEGALAGLPANAATLRERVEMFLSREDVEYAGVEAAHICTALERALAGAGAADAAADGARP